MCTYVYLLWVYVYDVISPSIVASSCTNFKVKKGQGLRYANYMRASIEMSSVQFNFGV